MKKLIFADGRETEVQSVSAADGVMHIRMILSTSEQIKALFGDAFATSRMILWENHVETASYENYTDLKWIKEETGGIWEVELWQTEADTGTRLEKLEQTASTQTKRLDAQEKRMEALKTDTAAMQENFDMAVAELTIVMAAMMEGGEDM